MDANAFIFALFWTVSATAGSMHWRLEFLESMAWLLQPLEPSRCRRVVNFGGLFLVSSYAWKDSKGISKRHIHIYLDFGINIW